MCEPTAIAERKVEGRRGRRRVVEVNDRRLSKRRFVLDAVDVVRHGINKQQDVVTAPAAGQQRGAPRPQQHGVGRRRFERTPRQLRLDATHLVQMRRQGAFTRRLHVQKKKSINSIYFLTWRKRCIDRNEMLPSVVYYRVMMKYGLSGWCGMRMRGHSGSIV